MDFLDVMAISFGSIGCLWAIRELCRRDRPGQEVQGRYGRWTRLPQHDDIDTPF